MSERQTTQTVAKAAFRPFPRTTVDDVSPTPSGEFVVITNEYFIDKETGEKMAKPGQKVDWDAYIQASRDACDLSSIVARYLSGDVSVINVNPGAGFYGDLAAMPTNINEVQDLADRCKTGYDKLDPEVKAIFGDSFENFYNAVLSNTVESKIQAYAKAKAEAAQSAVSGAVPEEGDK